MENYYFISPFTNPTIGYCKTCGVPIYDTKSIIKKGVWKGFLICEKCKGVKL